MKIVCSEANVIHNPRWEFSRGRRIYSKDIPSRAAIIRKALEESDMSIEWIEPKSFPEGGIAEVHSYFDYVRRVTATLNPDEIIYPDVFPIRRKVRRPTHNAVLAGYYCFDTATPLTRNTFDAAKSAVDCALTAAELLPREGLVYALCRPPGHHAEQETFGGYCYFNNLALAARLLSPWGRIAILDLDFHHGNGTQDIFYDSAEVFTASIHGDPEQTFPYFSGFSDEKGAGEGFGANLNLPLSPGASFERFLSRLDEALTEIRNFRPRALLLAVGFDNSKGDPAGSFDLYPKHYPVIAQRVASLGYPTLIIQEGGYRTETLGRNAVSFLRAFVKGACW